MGKRKYILIFVSLLAAYKGRAQRIQSFEQADSVSNAQYLAGNWAQLIATGKNAIAAGYDSPALRQRLGYAQMLSGDYSRALKEYNAVFKHDTYNSTARYYAYLCNQYLNRDAGASFQAAYLDTNQLKGEHLKPFGLVIAGLETSLKYNENIFRNDGNYTRAYVTQRLSWRLQLTHSVAYFKQDFYSTPVEIPGTPFFTLENSTNKQFEYYGKLDYSLAANLQLIGVYHYFNSKFLNGAYNSHIGSVGLRYSGTRMALQGNVNMGVMIGQHINQYSASVMYYPNGNLNFYTISRGSYLQQGDGGTGIFSQSVGYKLFKNLWAESNGTFGNLNNYIDADGLYIYNAIDETRLKLGETAFYQFGAHIQLQLNYTYEKKHDDIHSLNYNQHSFTAGLLWKF